MKRTLSFILSIIMILASFSLVVNAAEPAKYQPEVGDGYIRFDASQVIGGTVNHVPSANIERNVTFEGKNAIKFTPTPDADGAAKASGLNIDCYSLANYEAKVEVPKYKYVGVTYYYATDDPTYAGKPWFSILPGNTKATPNLAADANEKIVTNQWTEAYFSFSSTMKVNQTEKPWINQVHFRPFPGVGVSQLKPTDVIYIAYYTFYENNPDPNSKATIEFLKGNPDAQGEMEPLIVKTGEKYKIPSADFITFPAHKATFLGWKNNTDGKLYQPGEEFTAGDGIITYTAEWNIESNEEFIALNFCDYQNGIVNRMNTGTVEEVVEDGKSCVKVVPNPESEAGKKFTIDGYQYLAANIDLNVFHWIGIEYKYVSENPVDARMYTAIMRNGNLFPAGKSASAESLNKLVTNQWTTAWFDYTMLPDVLDPATADDHRMRQMHIRPFGNGDLFNFSKDDTMYISRVMFFREKPDLTTHKAYMTGYNDATFKPNKTMTRAEACTVVARLLDTEENIAKNTTTAFTDVAADKWYTKYISFCEAKGLLKSYRGTFLPEQNITRAEFAELVYNMGLAKEDASNKKTFTDVTEAHPKYAAIMAAASAGLIGGYEDGTFLPDRTITRAQVVTIINRARGVSRKPEQIPGDIYTLFVDVDGTHWAFADIAEATLEHVEMNGEWAYAVDDPINSIVEKVGEQKLFDFAKGNAKVAEYDALEAKRIEEIRNTPNMPLSEIKGKVYYVSSSTGDDKNDGLSEATPFASIRRALAFARAGDAILLKRGDMWRETIALGNDLILSAYGEGAKPVINASPENGADPAKWTLVYKNDQTGSKIWKYANEKFLDVGNIVFNDGEGYGYKEVPTCVGNKYVVRGTTTPFDYTVELNRNFEFFHRANSVASTRVIDPGSAVGPLYLRCDNGNPGDIFDSIEFSVHGNAIMAKSGNVIDNICIKYPGSHGIGMGTVKDVLVQNCEIGWIGGSVQTYDYHGAGGPATRFGNGVEVYGGCDGYVVDNCYIYQNYDAGVTHQFAASGAGNIDMSNVTYSNNVITDTVYSVEYFQTEVPEYRRTGKNILIEGNLFRRAGYGFGSTRPDGHNQGHIRSGGTSNPFENFVIRNNVFDRSVQYLVQAQTSHDAYKPKMQGNIYIQGKDNHAFTFGVPSVKIYADAGTPGRVKGFLGDATGVFYYVENIPYYEFKFDYAKTSDKEYPVVSENPLDYTSGSAPVAPTTPAEPEVKEEILAPYFVRNAEGTEKKDAKTKLYADLRASMNPEIKTDPETGAKYLHITINNTNNAILLDCHGLNPVIPFKDGQVVFKALVRTNYSAKPTMTYYHLKDAEGTEFTGKSIGKSGETHKADGKWEEVYMVANNIDVEYASSGQIHFFPWGSGVKGQSFYNEDGTPKQADLYYDIAAWAMFPNLSSAKAYDLSANTGASGSLVGATGTTTPSAPSTPSAPADNGEVSAPYFVRTAIGTEKKDKKTQLYADIRASMNNTVMTDPETGYKFVRTTLNPTSNSILYDCFGLSAIPLASGKVVFKVLIRTNYSATPYLNFYGLADSEGNKVSGKSVSGSATEALVADDKWHEVVITIKNNHTVVASSTQIHFMPWGGAVKGNSFFDEDGKCLTNPEPYFDVAAWAVFPNEASAKAYSFDKDIIPQ